MTPHQHTYLDLMQGEITVEPDVTSYASAPLYAAYHYEPVPAGVDPASLAGDLERRFAEAYPARLEWTDRRPVGVPEAARRRAADLGRAFRFLHVSTDEVYGSLGETGFFTETTPCYSGSGRSLLSVLSGWVKMVVIFLCFLSTRQHLCKLSYFQEKCPFLKLRSTGLLRQPPQFWCRL